MKKVKWMLIRVQNEDTEKSFLPQIAYKLRPNL